MSMDPAQKGAFAFLGLLAVGVAAVPKQLARVV